jgi:hypothetical protein
MLNAADGMLTMLTMLTMLPAMLIVAVYAMVARQPRTRHARLPNQKAARPIPTRKQDVTQKRLASTTTQLAGTKPLRSQHHRTRVVPRNYRTAASKVSSQGMQLFINRLRAEWAQRRCEQREFKAWLEITAKPLW